MYHSSTREKDKELSPDLPFLMNAINHSPEECKEVCSKQDRIKPDGTEISFKKILRKIVLPQPVHSEFACNECEVDAIIGNRYYSKTSEDFNLCETCEDDKGHTHIMNSMALTTSKSSHFNTG